MPKKIFKGNVVSDKMQKTVVISIDIPKKHALYGKSIKNTKRFKARNDIGAKLGDLVIIEECSPYSKLVTWEVIEIVTEEKKN